MSHRQVYHHIVETRSRTESVFSFSPDPPDFVQWLMKEKETVMQRYSNFLWSQTVERRRELLNRGIFPPQNKWNLATYRVNEPKAPRDSTGIRKARMEARVMKKAPLFADELIERETEAKPEYFAGTSEIDDKRQRMYRESKEGYERAVRSAESN